MKKIFVIICCLLFSLLLSSCLVNQSQFTDSDKKVVFLPSDVENLDLTGYQLTKMLGRDYFYSKEKVINGLSVYFSEKYLGEGRYVRFKTIINVFEREESAIMVYNLRRFQYKTGKLKGFIEVDSSEYKADRAFIAKDNDRFVILLQKSNVFYLVDIQGLNINEDQVKTRLIYKVNNIFSGDFWKKQAK